MAKIMSCRSINDKIFQPIMTEAFTESAIERLQKYLVKNNQANEIELLTPDASTREYFRIKWQAKPAIACIYPEPFLSNEHTYLDVTNLFLEANLPVAEIYDFDGALGVIVQEDFGDKILRDVLNASDETQKESLINRAISIIAKIQAATKKAFELNSVASKIKFDTEKLLWELNFFKTHYFETFRKEKLSDAEDKAITAEFIELASELERRAHVLCHRDFHAANLMLDAENQLRIIDHQDARIGAASYDLVSLLLDRVTELPTPEWLAEKRLYLLSERENLGLEKIDEADFAGEFRLQTIQRCLKAIGTFSFQSVNRGKTYFIPFIKPMFQIVLRATDNLHQFPNLQKIIERRLNS
jgi:aminoglycoside/choline kinase family phosphotransferase